MLQKERSQNFKVSIKCSYKFDVLYYRMIYQSIDRSIIIWNQVESDSSCNGLYYSCGLWGIFQFAALYMTNSSPNGVQNIIFSEVLCTAQYKKLQYHDFWTFLWPWKFSGKTFIDKRIFWTSLATTPTVITVSDTTSVTEMLSSSPLLEFLKIIIVLALFDVEMK